ncbi:MAG: metallophosphoesterase [Balneolaceae bacterium]|nr:metallophosphoesterase [Balneolaceae bacterium]
MRKTIVYCFLAALLWISCSTSGNLYLSDAMREAADQPTREILAKPSYTIFLIGDTGAASLNPPDPVMTLLERKLSEADSNSAVIFLGDNLYPDGLPPRQDEWRSRGENRLKAQLKAVEDFRGKIYFIPGNHDWGKSGRRGLERLRRQERFIENYLERGNTFLPDSGYPGPVDIKLLDKSESSIDRDLHLLIIDTQWWFVDGLKTLGDGVSYRPQSRQDFLDAVEQKLQERKEDMVLVAGHHPFYAAGRHAGHLPLKQHFLPPVFGSFYVLYRKTIGLEQDITHRHYEKLKNELTDLFEHHDGLIYAAGHQHNLQYFRVKEDAKVQHHLLSGSGSKVDYTPSGKGAEFSYEGMGFLIIRFYRDGSRWLEAWTPSDSLGTGRKLLEAPLLDLNWSGQNN